MSRWGCIFSLQPAGTHLAHKFATLPPLLAEPRQQVQREGEEKYRKDRSIASNPFSYLFPLPLHLLPRLCEQGREDGELVSQVGSSCYSAIRTAMQAKCSEIGDSANSSTAA